MTLRLALMLVLALVCAPNALADPALPDFSSMPKAAAKDFTVRDGLAYSVRGFRTPSGAYCTSSSHRGMSALDCHGRFFGAPDGANSAHLFNNSPEPLRFGTEDVDFTKTPEFEGHPLPLLLPGVDYAFDNSHCAYIAGYQLACAMDLRGSQVGFVATPTDFAAIGQ
ncbi:hypothetical protein [Mycobacteroides abscessus]|uniref:hypothetical protein n=1 Tax=Mycobacteroides abscessus TaxID=36809 RepID=UPI000C269D46|nr:hypothetical protein [Mycobacteroides abscessus]